MSNEIMKQRWETMKNLMETEGVAAVLEFIGNADAFGEKLQLYFQAQQSFGGQDWKGKNFDAYLELVHDGMDAIQVFAQTVEDPEKQDQLKDYVNMMSFNAAADLAHCWPGDTVPRETRHFEAGIAAAEQCLKWRVELNKGPGPFHMAHWVKGIHHFALNQLEDAVTHFDNAVMYARDEAVANNDPPDLTVSGNPMIAMYEGYLGLARKAVNPDDNELYQKAIDVLQQMIKEKPERKDDADFFLQQLQWVDR